MWTGILYISISSFCGISLSLALLFYMQVRTGNLLPRNFYEGFRRLGTPRKYARSIKYPLGIVDASYYDPSAQLRIFLHSFLPISSTYRLIHKDQNVFVSSLNSFV